MMSWGTNQNETGERFFTVECRDRGQPRPRGEYCGVPRTNRRVGVGVDLTPSGLAERLEMIKVGPAVHTCGIVNSCRGDFDRDDRVSESGIKDATDCS